MGPIPIGVNKFLFEADPPNLTKIPASEILGVTVILLTCSYDGREFVRVGYYVNNEYDSEELQQDPPAKPAIDRVRRNILAEKPRVTRFAIKWDSEDSAPAEFPPEQPEADIGEDDEKQYGAEEVELEEALIKEEAELKQQQEDAEMEGADDTIGAENKVEVEDDDESDAGSEDLEADSSGSEDDDGEEEEEGEGADEGEEGEDEDMEMGEDDGENTKTGSVKAQDRVKGEEMEHQHSEVMVH